MDTQESSKFLCVGNSSERTHTIAKVKENGAQVVPMSMKQLHDVRVGKQVTKLFFEPPANLGNAHDEGDKRAEVEGNNLEAFVSPPLSVDGDDARLIRKVEYIAGGRGVVNILHDVFTKDRRLERMWATRDSNRTVDA